LIAYYDDLKFSFQQVFTIEDKTSLVFEHHGKASMEKVADNIIEEVKYDALSNTIQIQPW